MLHNSIPDLRTLTGKKTKRIIEHSILSAKFSSNFEFLRKVSKQQYKKSVKFIEAEGLNNGLDWKVNLIL